MGAVTDEARSEVLAPNRWRAWVSDVSQSLCTTPQFSYVSAGRVNCVRPDNVFVLDNHGLE